MLTGLGKSGPVPKRRSKARSGSLGATRRSLAFSLLRWVGLPSAITSMVAESLRY